MQTTLPKGGFVRQGSGIHRVVAEYGGSPTALAKAIEADGGKVTRQHVEYWLKAGKVPAEHLAAVHRAAKGVVSFADLNPDVDWDYVLRSRRKAAA